MEEFEDGGVDKAGIFFWGSESGEADSGQEVFEGFGGGHHVGGEGVGVEDLVALEQRPLTIGEGHLWEVGSVYSDVDSWVRWEPAGDER